MSNTVLFTRTKDHLPVLAWLFTLFLLVPSSLLHIQQSNILASLVRHADQSYVGPYEQTRPATEALEVAA